MTLARATATVYVLKEIGDADGTLDGYAFADRDHAHTWLSQAHIKDGQYAIVEATAYASSRRCGCCGAIHWWMAWRGKRVRVRGAWKPPTPPPDDGEE